MDCKGCVFCKVDGEKQAGCEANRIEIFQEKEKATVADDGFYELKQFCNLYRDDQWLEIHGKKQNLLEVAKLEVLPMFGIVLQDSLDQNEWDDFKNLALKLKDIDYDPRFIKVILSTSRKRGVETVCALVDEMRKTLKHTSSVFHEHDIQPLQEYENFMKIVNSNYFVNMRTWESPELSPTLFKEIEARINQDLEQFVIHVEDNVSIVLKNLMNTVYPKFWDYQQAVDEIWRVKNEAK